MKAISIFLYSISLKNGLIEKKESNDSIKQMTHTADLKAACNARMYKIIQDSNFARLAETRLWLGNGDPNGMNTEC